MTGNRTRRLAAVWFADIVGYTALSTRDEDAALAVVDELQRLSYASVGDKGRVVKFLGDGVLAVFASATRALDSATELQNAFTASAVVREHACSLSIGVHVGEVVAADDGDVYGDGVNVAARIEGVAASGQIVVSEDVYRLIRNRPEYNPQSLGAHTLKGVEEPAELYVLAAPGAAPAAPPPATVAEPVSSRRPVAVGLAAAVVAFVGLSVAIASSVDIPARPEAPAIRDGSGVTGEETGNQTGEEELTSDGAGPDVPGVVAADSSGTDRREEERRDERTNTDGGEDERRGDTSDTDEVDPPSDEPALPLLEPAGDGLLVIVFGEGPGVRLAERNVLGQLRQRSELAVLDAGKIGFQDRNQPAVAAALRNGLGDLRRLLWERGAEFVVLGRIETSATTANEGGFVGSARLAVRLYRISTGETIDQGVFTVGMDGEAGKRNPLAGFARTLAADEAAKQAAAAARGWLVQALRR